MLKPVWFPFYANDFLASSKVALLTTEEVGAYILLLCHAWQDPHCSLPDDDEALSKLGRIKGDVTALRACFTEKKSRLINERLYEEWIKAQQNKDLAKQAAIKRWHPSGNADALRPLSSSSSSSPSPSPKNRRTEEPLHKEVKTCTEAAPAVLKVSKTGRIWEAYRTAYIERYHTPPICNAKVNGQLAQVVNRLGTESAPPVATFYLLHNEPFYVRSRHSINFLLRDCEGLHTQMMTGVKATTGEARNIEKQDDAREQVKRVEAMLKGGL